MPISDSERDVTRRSAGYEGGQSAARVGASVVVSVMAGVSVADFAVHICLFGQAIWKGGVHTLADERIERSLDDVQEELAPGF